MENGNPTTEEKESLKAKSHPWRIVEKAQSRWLLCARICFVAAFLWTEGEVGGWWSGAVGYMSDDVASCEVLLDLLVLNSYCQTWFKYFLINSDGIFLKKYYSII